MLYVWNERTMMRKTETYFLRVISSSADLAAPVADHLRQHYPTLCPRTIIVAPSQEYSIRHPNPRLIHRYDQRITPERTLVFGDDRLVVIEQHTDATLSDISIPFEQVVRIEWAMVLLYAYVSFTWIADQRLKTLKIEYNAVGDEIVRGELERLRRAQHDPEADTADLVSLDSDDVLPLKFRNYLRYVLIPGESVRQIIFQPGRERSPGFWWFRASEGRTLALTSAEMIVMEESGKWLNLGIVIRCFPLRAIQDIQFEPEGDRVWLRVRVGASAVGEETSLSLSELNARCLSDGLQRFAPFIPLRWTNEAGVSLVEATR
jgi:hypothetical protein